MIRSSYKITSINRTLQKKRWRNQLVKRVSCEICGQRILGNSYLRVHKKRKHNEVIEETFL